MSLHRFVQAQEGVHAAAKAELTAGRKRTHWMWFVFPQLTGLGSSPTAQAYAIKDLAEAKAYLDHPVLGPRLRELAGILTRTDKSAADVFGHPDDLKLRSSMTLFAAAAGDPAPFQQVIDHFFDGPDQRTLELLKA
ncbi:hypothetical protein Aab01nite_02900 [Paractinoplanes abujensis]|uniref:Uncharacterized protein (DUF1810 family) n=1 Tax=Paractinoplanes abujensis TaxID=882441 RepID=A0A7W7CRD3_9ACTN|nr:DUF1810 domain-containing protein [Actinoplanes abujensis]MBB4691878.1 uncharacterized protein (DUF1810 family) [Actinoplanes abujensis]GID16700.1 hypothetical protein Aab01nite_02900 [Actinoplanes abujensis]